MSSLPVAFGSPPGFSHQSPGVGFFEDSLGRVWWGDKLVGLPETFIRASQAWDGTKLVGNDEKRLFGVGTKTPSVLIEVGRTNLVPNSETPETVASAADNPAITIHRNEVIGDTAYVHFEKDGTGGVDLRPRTENVPISKTKPVTVSFDFKMLVNTHYQEVTVYGSAVDDVSNARLLVARMDSAGDITPSKDNVTVRKTEGADGFVRYSVTVDPVHFSGSGNLLGFDVGTIWEPAGEFSHEFRHPQQEESSFPTSYIPTEGESLSRTNDNYYLDLVEPVDPNVNGATISLAWRQHEWDNTTIAHGYGQPYHLSIDDDTGAISVRIWKYTGHEPILFVADYWAGGSRKYTDIYESHLGSPLGANEWHTLSMVFSPSSYTLYYDGVPIVVEEPSGSFNNYKSIRLGRGDAGNSHSNSFLAPGSAPLGIPFLDTRAWTAQEIADAHNTWLAELNTIDLPTL